METLGFIGGAISVSAGVPQIIKCIKTGQTKDLTYFTNAISYVGSMISIYYGASIKHTAIICINVYSLVVNTILFCVKVHYEVQSRTYDQIEESSNV